MPSSFYYVMELDVNEQRANYALRNQELIDFIKSRGCEFSYTDGILTVRFPDNQDLDEEVMIKLLLTLKVPVNAKEYIYENGRKIEFFSGKLDPQHPLGQAKEEIQERVIESIEEEDEGQVKGSYEDLLDDIDEEPDEE